MKLFIEYLRPNFRRMSLGMFIKFIGAIMDLLLPWILAYIIDSVIPTKKIPLVIWWGVAMLACSVVAIVTNVVANRMAARVARDTTEKVRHDLFAKVSLLSTTQFEEVGLPSLVSRLTTDTYNIHQSIGMSQRIGIRAPILLLGGIFITFTLDPILTWVLIGVLPFTVATVYFVSKKGIPLFTKLQVQIDKLVRTVRENITGARVIKALSKTPYEIGRFTQVNDELVAAETKANQVMALTSPFMNFFLNGGLTLVILVAAYRVNDGLTQPGVIVAFLTYFTIILNAMLSITRIFVSFSRGLASADRIQGVLRLKPDLKVVPDGTVVKASVPQVVFKNVSFNYPNGGKVVTDLNFAVPKGTTLGIIGGTGTGKTTIIKLLLRLYDATKGEIQIAGRDIKSIPEKELHQMFGVAMQKDKIFADSILNNIVFGREITPEQVQEALVAAQAQEFVEKLPEGLDYQLKSNGSNLSGGQRQRVLLARALAGPPEILILDDSSSALDYKTDAQLRKALRQLQDTTKILIAQRISSIQHADQIIVLVKGQIAGLGTHENLLQTCPEYQAIYLSQGGAVA
ncbi:ABC transporter ATP-binding protein [Enterococcus nangangensis]|uniref:ABC transporter ATP-binding protein n=1 Tax=Enterococcus nangangensis TaxID=2559926 RepID=UPI0010FA6179|nr:ABC transporter ATP-binding protein [Enterococcus nangangensis]